MFLNACGILIWYDIIEKGLEDGIKILTNDDLKLRRCYSRYKIYYKLVNSFTGLNKLTNKVLISKRKS